MNVKMNQQEFKSLPYSYDALEPHIDAMTMEIHHSRHHKAYFDNLMAATKDSPMAEMTFKELFGGISKLPMAARNHGGGTYNHDLFWSVMSPNGGGLPKDALANAIVKDFGSFEAFQEKFNTAAKTRFGSGWAWLCVKEDNSLCVCSTANQDNPLMDIAECPGTPILCLDVWEHAYYLKYQNKRPDYVSAFWNVINWDEVEKNYANATK